VSLKRGKEKGGWSYVKSGSCKSGGDLWERNMAEARRKGGLFQPKNSGWRSQKREKKLAGRASRDKIKKNGN